MAGGAAAALTGLVVVALSLHAKVIMAHPLSRGRAFAAILALLTHGFRAAWHDCYVMAGGAAAALTGLVVVALSLHAKVIMAHPLYRDRAFAAILALMTQVFLSAAVLVPGQPPAALGIEIGIAALFWFGRSLWAIPYIRNNTRRLRGRASEHRRSMAQWVAEWSVWIAWVIALMASSTALIAGSADGFYWLAAAMVLMFGSQVWSAWVLIAEVSE